MAIISQRSADLFGLKATPIDWASQKAAMTPTTNKEIIGVVLNENASKQLQSMSTPTPNIGENLTATGLPIAIGIKPVYLIIAVVVLVVGYFAWKKYGK